MFNKIIAIINTKKINCKFTLKNSNYLFKNILLVLSNMLPTSVFSVMFLLTCSLSIQAKDFEVVVGLAKPPYVLEDEKSGFEIELVSQVLASMGKPVKFVFIPFGRTPKMLESKGIDAIMTVNNQTFHDPSLLSNVYINYQNVAISLKRNEFEINSIADLSNRTIASFQLAHKVLGEEFADAVSKSPMFIQVANQLSQPQLLISNRIDVLVMDVRIFRFIIRQLGLEMLESQIAIHEIFPLSPYRMAFKDKSNVALFNDMLIQYKTSDAYKDLKSKYSF